MLLGSNIDLLVHLNDLKLLGEPERILLGHIVKEKTAGSKDNSSKVILSGFTARLQKHRDIKTANKDSKGQPDLSKFGFRTKYLITSD
jgi:hypothetical protein